MTIILFGVIPGRRQVGHADFVGEPEIDNPSW